MKTIPPSVVLLSALCAAASASALAAAPAVVTNAVTVFDACVVKGTGGENDRVHCKPVTLAADAFYLFTFTARRSQSGSGIVVSGPDCANVDWGIADPVPAVKRFAFRTPSGAPRAQRFHLGGWCMTGEVAFENASVRPARLEWKRTADGLELGHGEAIDGNRYTFNTQMGGAARNACRPLFAHDVGYNTSRWLFVPRGRATYRHVLAGRRFLAGTVSAGSPHFAHGVVAIEVSKDGANWVKAGGVTNAATFKFPLPAAVLPAETLWVRFVGDANASGQIGSYGLEVQVDGAPTMVCGATRIFDGVTGELVENLRASTYFDDDYGERLVETDAAAAWRASSARKVPPLRALPPATARAQAVEIRTAPNESEAAQLVVHAKKALTGVRVSVAGDLAGANGAHLAASCVDVRRVACVPIEIPTDGAGCRGLWPDPLLAQTAEGCAIAAGGNGVFRIRVKPPKTTPKGTWRGALAVTYAGGSFTVPLVVETFGFVFPDVVTLETAFGFSPGVAFRYHHATKPEEKERTLDAYFKLLAASHVSPYNPAPLAPFAVTWKGLDDPASAEPVFDWTKWDAAVEKGFAHYRFNTIKIPVHGLGGGTFHSRTEPSFHGIPGTNALYHVLMGKYLGGIERHLREKGWLDKAYVYWFDEPDAKDYAFVMNGFATLKRHAPGLRRMLTEQPETELLGGPNVWCVSTPKLHSSGEAACRAAGDTFWWYVCCGPRAPYVTEFIDHAGVEMRTWSWQTWKEKVQGLLVWETNYWTSDAAYPDEPQNPYLDAMSWVCGYSTKRGTKNPWGNGDGRFVYPPPAAADGKAQTYVADDPVPSIRLEMLGDGIEDYEYLAMLKRRLARGTDAERKQYGDLLVVPGEITRTMTDFAVDPTPIETRRLALARALEALRP